MGLASHNYPTHLLKAADRGKGTGLIIDKALALVSKFITHPIAMQAYAPHARLGDGEWFFGGVGEFLNFRCFVLQFFQFGIVGVWALFFCIW